METTTGPSTSQRRDQVGQRLAGAGAGLHQQVLLVRGGLGHGGGHLLLARPGRAAGHRADRRREEVVEGGVHLKGKRQTVRGRPGRRGGAHRTDGTGLPQPGNRQSPVPSGGIVRAPWR